MLHDADTTLSPVRLASPADETDLMAVLRAMHEESGLLDCEGRLPPFCADKALAHLRRATMLRASEPGTAWCGIIGEPEAVEGAIYLAVEEPPLSRQMFLAMKWDYVAPPYRRSRIVDAMFLFARTLADRLRLTLVTATSSERQIAKHRLYQYTFGCRPLGAVFVYTPSSTVPAPGPLHAGDSQ